jgi:hypothetical protein
MAKKHGRQREVAAKISPMAMAYRNEKHQWRKIKTESVIEEGERRKISYRKMKRRK